MVIGTPKSHFHIQRLKYHLLGQSGGRNKLKQIYLMSWNVFKRTTTATPPRLQNFPSSVLWSRTSESSGHDSQLHSDRLCPAHTSLSERRADKHCTPTGKHFSFCTLIIGKVSCWKLLISKIPLKQYFFTSTGWTLLRPVFGKHGILCKQSASEGHNPGSQNLQLKRILVLTVVESKDSFETSSCCYTKYFFFYLGIIWFRSRLSTMNGASIMS